MILRPLALLAAISAATLAHASDDGLVIGRAGVPARLMIVISDCFENDEGQSFAASRARLGRYVNALRVWRHRQGEPLTEHLPYIETTSTGACSMDVDDQVPEFVRRNHHNHPEHSGPNCWDTSLALSGIVPGFRYVSGDEFWMWMSSPLCRMLRPGEARAAGDVIAIRNAGSPGASAEIHGYVYLSDDLVFSKNGYSNAQPFALQTQGNVLRTYGMADSPASCTRADTLNPAGCARYANTFRCQSFSSYLRARPEPLPQDFSARSRDLLRAECDIERRAMRDSQPISQTDALLLTAAVATVEAAASDRITALATATDGPSVSDRFLWTTLRERSRSLRAQIGHLERE